MSKKILLKETLRGAAKGALKQALIGSVAGASIGGSYNIGSRDKYEQIKRMFDPSIRNEGAGWADIDIDRSNKQKIHDAISNNPPNSISSSAKKGALGGAILDGLRGAIKDGSKSYKETKKRLLEEKNMKIHLDDGLKIKEES